MDATQLIAPGFNFLIIAALGFMIKHEMNDIKARIMRIENTFFPSKEYSHE